MSFLLDSDICSAHLRRPGPLFHRFMQHAGRLCISTITLSDLYTWAYKQTDPTLILDKVQDFLRDVQVLPFDDDCALKDDGHAQHGGLHEYSRTATGRLADALNRDDLIATREDALMPAAL